MAHRFGGAAVGAVHRDGRCEDDALDSVEAGRCGFEQTDAAQNVYPGAAPRVRAEARTQHRREMHDMGDFVVVKHCLDRSSSAMSPRTNSTRASSSSLNRRRRREQSAHASNATTRVFSRTSRHGPRAQATEGAGHQECLLLGARPSHNGRVWNWVSSRSPERDVMVRIIVVSQACERQSRGRDKRSFCFNWLSQTP